MCTIWSEDTKKYTYDIRLIVLGCIYCTGIRIRHTWLHNFLVRLSNCIQIGFFFNLAELKLSFFGWIRAASKTLIQLQLHKLNTVLKREFVWIEIYLLKCLNKKSLHSYNTNSNLMIFSASSRGRKNRDPKPLRRLLTAIKKNTRNVPCFDFRLQI